MLHLNAPFFSLKCSSYRGFFLLIVTFQLGAIYHYRNSKRTREDKGDREGILRAYTPYFIGNLSRVIFKTTDPKGNWTTANHIAQMCSAWMTHPQSHASFTNWGRKKWRKTWRAILLFVFRRKREISAKAVSAKQKLKKNSLSSLA